MSQVSSLQDTKKTLVQASFDRWARGTGSPFEIALASKRVITVSPSAYIPLTAGTNTRHGSQWVLRTLE
jgi:hypothetical protein